MPTTLYRMGSKGPEVEQIQRRLKELGYYALVVDGDFGGGTESAVKRFQRDKGLSQDGQVGPNTWKVLFPPAPPPPPPAPVPPPTIPEPSVTARPLRARCLELTGAFETSAPPPGCYSKVSGNFDGQGVSFGCLQWNFGQGSLHALLKRLDQLHPNAITEVFHAHAPEIRTVMNMTKAGAVAWAKARQTPHKALSEPWLGLLKALGARAECQAVQQEFADGVFKSALQLCRDYGLKTERAVALMFDIVTQNGSIKPATRALILQDFAGLAPSGNAMEDEAKRLVVVANRRADAASAPWREDVRTRKLTIANGAGFVHGGRYHLLEGYNIGLRPAAELG
jgi:hypothetical protein